MLIHPLGLEAVQGMVPEAEVGPLLAEQGQKAVYRGRVSGRDVVLKVLELGTYEDEGDDPEADPTLLRLQRELRVLSECQCDTLVRVEADLPPSIRLHSGHRYAVYAEEFLDGPTLTQALAHDGSLPLHQVLGLGVDVARALQAMHERGFVHRDVKPDNIMLVGGRSVLLDPGIAFAFDEPSVTTGPRQPGTAGYRAPEQDGTAGRRATLDGRTDLFALGVTMGRAALGYHPYAPLCGTNPSRNALQNAINTNDWYPDLAPELPTELRPMLMRLLQRQRHLRYLSAAQFIEVVQHTG